MRGDLDVDHLAFGLAVPPDGRSLRALQLLGEPLVKTVRVLDRPDLLDGHAEELLP